MTRFLRLGVSGGDMLLMLLAGGFGALAFPPCGWYLAAPAAYFILFWRIRDYPPERARNAALLFGFAYSLGTMHWLFGLFGFWAVSLMAVVALYHGLLGHLVAATRGLTPLLRAAALAGLAVGIEYWRGEGPWLPFPWYTIPHALAQEPAWLALARWTGTYGLSFIVLGIIAAAALHRWRWLMLLGLLPLASLALPPLLPPDRTALLVQAEASGAAALVRTLPDIACDLAVFPELAWLQEPATLRRLPDGPWAVAQRYAAPVIFGAVEGRYGDTSFYNVAALVGSAGELRGIFTKQRPVPLMVDGLPGRSRPVFPDEQGVFGIAICYDADAPDVLAELTRAGATLLVIPTYDAMDWGVQQHEHHGLLTRLRAVENNRWLLRAASSGRSEVIDPHGHPSVAGLAIGSEGWLRADYRHTTARVTGSELAALGPLLAALTGWYLLALLVLNVLRRNPGDWGGAK